MESGTRSQEMATVVVRWGGQEYSVDTSFQDTVGSLKAKLAVPTKVQVSRQKLLGLKLKGKPAPDDALLSDTSLKQGQKLMMMGQPEEVIEAGDKQAEVAPEVQDDFDIPESDMVEVELKDREEVKAKLQRRIDSTDVKVLNAPRPGKKCVVLDIDYTIFDLGSSAERPEELARPHLHEFMKAVYDLYDIIIWSATSMKWVEVKMRELGVTTHPDYKISFMLDHRAMITVQTERYGVFDCKPLGFIWAKFPDQYGPHNTIMLDDLRRNFVMNKQNGLVIRPFRKAHLTRDTDKELVFLEQYLLKIGSLDDLSSLKHRKWEQYLQNFEF
ncbi:hypothetical protein WJX74_008288 [Apatococcus lobatus]|uniref:protein-serine/threonine phosphatase n=2 Tax=Apatococcus TaxID=904362 RepID=A0AAW1TB39_9CHLO